MNRIIALLLLFSIYQAGSFAQTLGGHIIAFTDKQCYLAGERLCVRVDVSQPSTMQQLPDRVAYVEISDTQQMMAQAMVYLADGQGWAEIALPTRMHSGTYQLTAYTRAMRNVGEEAYFHTEIGVINGEQLSRRDNICFVPDAALAAASAESMKPQPLTYKPMSEVSLQLPEALEMGCAITVEASPIASSASASYREHAAVLAVEHASAIQDSPFVAELEGHIVQARPLLEGSAVDITRLALVGKMASVYDGQPQADGSYLYYTNGITGNLPALVNAYTYEGDAIPMQMESPYAQVLPSSLPELKVSCTEQVLLERASSARKQAVVNDWLKADTLSHTLGFMSAAPRYFYDLDEYTQMSTIRELLVEFVRGIQRRKEQGVSMLFTYDPDTHSYSRWPAIVLLDGMPVYDVDEILGYDAHLVKYVQIYTERFAFGRSCCQGVISFITRGGRLSNYKLDIGSRLVSYSFPQDHPAFVPHTTSCPPSGCYHSTLIWEPAAQGLQYTFRAPAAPGDYLVTMQGRKKDGTIVFEQQKLTVANFE